MRPGPTVVASQRSGPKRWGTNVDIMSGGPNLAYSQVSCQARQTNVTLHRLLYPINAHWMPLSLWRGP